MTDLLKQKMEYSIQLLKKAEKLAIRYDSEDGFFLAFSGGKDSQALYHIAEMAGVKFKAHFSPTTVDPPQLIRFIRRNYPDVEFAKVKKNIYQVAVQKQILPSMRIRWCCAEFKENAGAGKVTLIGIRHEESVRRSKRKEVEVSGRKFSGYLDQFEEWSAEQMKKKYKNLNQDQFSYDKEKEIRCINGKDSILISPIIDWTERDVWEFLNEVVKVPHCELYDKGYKRIGCILCPMSSPKQKRREMQDFPYVKEKWLQAIAEIRRSGRGITRRTYVPDTEYQRTSEWEGVTEHTSTSKSVRTPIQQEAILQQPNVGGGNTYQPNPMEIQVLARNSNSRGSQEDGERAIEGYGKETFPNSAEERQICENIFDWWISGKSYERWYADKFLQGKLFEEIEEQ